MVLGWWVADAVEGERKEREVSENEVSVGTNQHTTINSLQEEGSAYMCDWTGDGIITEGTAKSSPVSTSLHHRDILRKCFFNSSLVPLFVTKHLLSFPFHKKDDRTNLLRRYVGIRRALHSNPSFSSNDKSILNPEAILIPTSSPDIR